MLLRCFLMIEHQSNCRPDEEAVAFAALETEDGADQHVQGDGLSTPR